MDGGDAEVDEADVLLALFERLEHDVFGLEVAVDDAAAVCAADGVADLPEDVGGAHEIHRPLLHQGAQAAALDVLHDDEGPPVGQIARVHHADDAGVVYARQSLDLLLELPAHPVLGVCVAELVEEHLDDHALLHQLHVAREVDDADAAPAELALDEVTPVEQFPREVPGPAGLLLFVLAHLFALWRFGSSPTEGAEVKADPPVRRVGEIVAPPARTAKTTLALRLRF